MRRWLNAWDSLVYSILGTTLWCYMNYFTAWACWSLVRASIRFTMAWFPYCTKRRSALPVRGVLPQECVGKSVEPLAQSVWFRESSAARSELVLEVVEARRMVFYSFLAGTCFLQCKFRHRADKHCSVWLKHDPRRHGKRRQGLKS